MKTALTTLVVIGVGMLVAWPWLVGPMPPKSNHHELAIYLERLSAYALILLLIFLASWTLAYLLMRRARELYREESRENVRFLIESTLEDHRKKDASHDA